MQPSQFEIQREVEALRDLRRRSTTPGALSIDPDLPSQPSPSSPSTAYWAATADSEASSSSSSHDGRSTTESSATSLSGNNLEGKPGDDPADDPFHLFWVPASVHPEIAPAEFRAFLQEHARSPPTSEDPTLLRSSSTNSPLGRKRSMLSRQYKPSEDDGVEQEQQAKIVPLRRNRSSLHTNHGPQLTIDDLQKLERLAEKASKNDDPSELRTMLRRSLSLNISPTAIEGMGKLPDLGDESDVPIIVPPPGQILRRAARTKIRKPGLPGDGGGHRFGASRRTRTRTLSENRTSSDQSSSEHGTEEFAAQAPLPERFSEDGGRTRPDSYSDASSIFDAYAREEDEADALAAANHRVTVSPPLEEIEEHSITDPEPEPEPELEPISETVPDEGPVLRHPQPTRLLSPPLPSEQPISRTPSPSETTSSSIDFPSQSSEPIQPQPNVPLQQPTPTPSPPPNRKEKDKKGLFAKWGSDKSSKKSSAKEREKEKDRENKERAEKEKESFFGSLFGGKKNKDSDPHAPGAQGRQSPLASRNKNGGASPAPGTPLPPGVNNYSRYPIHVERAIYRLSHIKLANPRRPLYEQVLISNLMFWYLGVINKAQQQQQQQAINATPNGQAPHEDAGVNGQPTLLQEQERREREQQEAERQRIERESTPEPAPTTREPEPAAKKKESPRRGPLTKPPPSGAGPRRAEMPVKGPQYEMQHRAMEQQYSYGMNSPQPYPVTSQPQPQAHHQNQQQQQQRLPPGAMPPVDQSKPLYGGGPPNTRTGGASPPPLTPNPRRSRSPPPASQMNTFTTNDWHNNNNNGGGAQSNSNKRSRSAIASPPPGGAQLRKGAASASASVPSSHHQWKSPSYENGEANSNGPGEEEDVPLAVWKQSRRSR